MKSKPKEQPDHIDGLTRLAAAICHHFKISCTRQGIKNWQTWPDPFPAPKESNRYNRRACFDWVEQHIMTKRAPNGSAESQTIFQEAAEAEARHKIRKDEEHKFEFEVTKGRYVERDSARRTITGALKKYHAWVRAEVERYATTERKEKLTALGASPEIVAAFHEFDLKQAQAVIDRIEQQCEHETKEADAIQV